MKRKIVIIIAALLVPLCFVSCMKETPDKTIVLFGEEAYVKHFKQVVGLSPDTLNALQVMSVTIDDSQSAPPDIRGEYRLANRIKIYPTSGFSVPNDTVYFRFGGDFDNWNNYLHGQHHFITHCDIKIPGLDLNSELYHTDTAYVKGQGSAFFAYLDRKIDVEAPMNNKVIRYTLHQGIVISGKMLSSNRPCDISETRLVLYNREVIINNGWDFTSEELEPIRNLRHTLYVYKDSNDITDVNRSGSPYIDWNL